MTLLSPNPSCKERCRLMACSASLSKHVLYVSLTPSSLRTIYLSDLVIPYEKDWIAKNAAQKLFFHNNADGSPYWGEGLVYEIPEELADRILKGAQVQQLWSKWSWWRSFLLSGTRRRFTICVSRLWIISLHQTSCYESFTYACWRLFIWINRYQDPWELLGLCAKKLGGKATRSHWSIWHWLGWQRVQQSLPFLLLLLFFHRFCWSGSSKVVWV